MNSTNHSFSNLIKDRVADSEAEGLRDYAFGDAISPNFVLEFENPTQIVLNPTYQLSSNNGNMTGIVGFVVMI